LFRKTYRFSILKSPWFQYTCGRESPTWTAWSLVLNWWDFALGSPINVTIRFWDFLGWSNSYFRLRIKISVNKFLLSQNSELVDSHFVSLTWVSVMFVDFVNIFSENNSSIFFLTWCPINSILRLPFFEGSIFGSLVGEVDSSSDESS
jgi:hypothetical protein